VTWGAVFRPELPYAKRSISASGSAISGISGVGEKLSSAGARTEWPATFRFKHALIQDAAYESLIKSRRQALHRRAGEILRDKPESAASSPKPSRTISPRLASTTSRSNGGATRAYRSSGFVDPTYRAGEGAQQGVGAAAAGLVNHAAPTGR